MIEMHFEVGRPRLTDYGDLMTEWAVLNNDVLETYGSEESARHQLDDFYDSDARLVSRVVTGWVDVG